VAILWQPPTELHLDALGYRILDNVQKRGVRRLFVDGFSSFRRVAAVQERLAHFITALANELRSRGVTTVYSNETRQIFTRTLAAPFTDDSSLVENLLLLRYDERDARLRRLLSIIKLRDNDFDHRVREFAITSNGIRIRETSTGGVVLHADATRSRRAEKPKSGAATPRKRRSRRT
jgi:circadian clock protein KaiC